MRVGVSACLCIDITVESHVRIKRGEGEAGRVTNLYKGPLRVMIALTAHWSALYNSCVSACSSSPCVYACVHLVARTPALSSPVRVIISCRQMVTPPFLLLFLSLLVLPLSSAADVFPVTALDGSVTVNVNSTSGDVSSIVAHNSGNTTLPVVSSTQLDGCTEVPGTREVEIIAETIFVTRSCSCAVSGEPSPFLISIIDLYAPSNFSVQWNTSILVLQGGREVVYFRLFDLTSAFFLDYPIRFCLVYTSFADYRCQ